mgnify:CR=1 FL=1
MLDHCGSELGSFVTEQGASAAQQARSNSFFRKRSRKRGHQPEKTSSFFSLSLSLPPQLRLTGASQQDRGREGGDQNAGHLHGDGVGFDGTKRRETKKKEEKSKVKSFFLPPSFFALQLLQPLFSLSSPRLFPLSSLSFASPIPRERQTKNRNKARETISF